MSIYRLFSRIIWRSCFRIHRKTHVRMVVVSVLNISQDYRMECAPHYFTPLLLLLLLSYSYFMILFFLEETLYMRHFLLGLVLLHEQGFGVKLGLEGALLHLRVKGLTRHSLEL